MPFLENDGLRIHYEVHGTSGEPIVFVHGYMGASTDWSHQIEAFAGEHRILVLDNRGHGRSEAPTDHGAYTVEAMAGDAMRVIEAVGFEPFHLVGHSIGGAVAQEIALLAPERLLSLTLQDTTHWFGDHDQPGGTPPYASPEDIEATTKHVAAMSQDAIAGGWAGLLAWRGATDRAHAIRVPTLILYGSSDASRILEGSQKLKALIPDAEVVVIEGAGHSPQRQCPAEYDAALRGFLERARG